MTIGSDGSLTVDTGNIILGPPIGTNTTGQEAEGPRCIGKIESEGWIRNQPRDPLIAHVFAATTQRTIGFVILAIAFTGGLLHVYFSIRGTKAEVGSELEPAPNRVPDLTDEELEGRHLDRTLTAGLVLLTVVLLLTVVSVSLPIYRLGEPGRHEGRISDTDRVFSDRGAVLHTEGAKCVNCHGPNGSGGSVSKSLTDVNGNFIAQVTWKAPALNTVLSRYSEDEVLQVLNFGRNGVMPAWGGPGGGPLSEQELETAILHLRSIQLDETSIRDEVSQGIRDGAAEKLVAESQSEWAVAVNDTRADAAEALDTAALELLARPGVVPDRQIHLDYGRIILANQATAGTYSCARCHTFGWSYDATAPRAMAENGTNAPLLDKYTRGGGFFGPNLTTGTTLDQFETAAQHAAFVTDGQSIGKTYGRGGSGGTGQMPGFGPRTDDALGITYPGLLTPEQIDAVVAFERNL